MKLIYILSFCLLSGCVTTKESFDCKYATGVGCRSISEVNTMVNNGQLEDKAQPKPLTNSKVSAEAITSDTALVQRVTEEHLRVWLAPFQDEQGHFHEASVIHSVLRPGFWQVEDMR